MLSTKVREKSAGKMRSMRLLAVLLVPVAALILEVAAPHALAGGSGWRVPFAEKAIFFEYNSTDKDLGLHIFFDAEAWNEVEVKGPDGEEIFETENDGSLSDLGSTEVFTESAEPPLCDEEDPEECSDEEIEEAIAEFQAQFPEGWYRFRGRTIEGKRLRGRAYLSHDLPNPPEINSPDPEDAGFDFDDFLADPIIEWEEDTTIVEYEVVAEMVIDEKTYVNTATLPGGAIQFMVSPEFADIAAEAKADKELEEFKIEVIARAANLNKTITESALYEAEE